MRSKKADWRIWIVAFLGVQWGISYAARMLPRAPEDLSALALLGVFSPILLYFRPVWLVSAARWFCLFQIGISALLFFGSLVSAMNPVGFHVYLFGFKLGTVWNLGGQFLYFALRATAFGVSAICLRDHTREGPNQSPEPTVMSVTPPAGQESRRP
jgi:hypothetical protein